MGRRLVTLCYFFLYGYGDHRDLPVLSHSFPTRRASGLFRPDLAAARYEPFPYDFRGEQAEGGKAFYELPVFTEWDGRLFVRCIPPYIWASQRHADAPRLTDLQREALQAVEGLAADPANHVTMELRAGDIQLINNFHVLHGRTASEDDRDHGQVRRSEEPTSELHS